MIHIIISLQLDDLYAERMAATHSYLLANCDFRSMEKHAISFCRLMFNANFRSLHCWAKEEHCNKKIKVKKTATSAAIYENNHYRDFMYSLPDYLKSWIMEERSTHVAYFKIRNENPMEVPKDDPIAWKNAFRRLFTISRRELYQKTKKVSLKLKTFETL